MTDGWTALWPYVVLLLAGVLPNGVWRFLGVVVSHGVDDRSEVMVWVRAVATAVIAGVVSQLLLITPPGALAQVPLAVRLIAAGVGFAGYLAMRRSVLAGVICGEVVLMAGSYWAGP